MSERDEELTGMETASAAAAAGMDEPELTEEDIRLLNKYKRMSTGTYSHSLDSKGRCVVPADLRKSLGKQFVCLPEHDFRSLAMYSRLNYVRMRESYDVKLKATGSSELKKYLMWLDALTYVDIETDGQGRVLLPGKLRQVILGEEREVDIMGANDHIRIAARPRCEAGLAAFIDGIDDTLQHI